MILLLINLLCFDRNLVSASQDGKLIVWDAYTTNKVEIGIIISLFQYSIGEISHFVVRFMPFR